MTYSGNGNIYLEKIASRQKLDDFAQDPKSFQEPIVKNIMTGFTYGGLGGSVYGMKGQLGEIQKAVNKGGNEALVESVFRAGENVTHHTLKGAMLGAGAGAVYGAIKHIPATVEHTDNHAHINGVYEYAAGHLDPYMGKVSGGVVGGLVGRRFHLPVRSGAGNIEKWTVNAIPGTLGTLAGAKIGQDQADRHNTRLLNRIKEKYYE